MGLGRLILEKKSAKTGLFGICSLGPKMQNKPLNFFLDGGLPNRAAGEGGSDTWEKLPNNPVFSFDGLPKLALSVFFFKMHKRIAAIDI